MTGLLALTCTLLLSLLGPQAAPRSLHPIVTLPTDQTVLGSIADMDVLPNGDIVVLDEQAKQLLVFSRAGGLVRTIGREGQGPGEIGGAGEVEVTATVPSLASVLASIRTRVSPSKPCCT